jgi:hypothetical protein
MQPLELSSVCQKLLKMLLLASKDLTFCVWLNFRNSLCQEQIN